MLFLFIFSLNVFIFLIGYSLKTHLKIKASHKKLYCFDLIFEVIFKITIKVIYIIFDMFWGGATLKYKVQGRRKKI